MSFTKKLKKKRDYTIIYHRTNILCQEKGDFKVELPEKSLQFWKDTVISVPDQFGVSRIRYNLDGLIEYCVQTMNMAPFGTIQRDSTCYYYSADKTIERSRIFRKLNVSTMSLIVEKKYSYQDSRLIQIEDRRINYKNSSKLNEELFMEVFLYSNFGELKNVIFLRFDKSSWESYYFAHFEGI